MAEIDTLFIQKNDTIARYNDCDPLSDYFHTTYGSLKYIISRIQEKGAKKISVFVVNNNPDTPAQKRINQICKIARYKQINKSYPAKRTYSRYPDNVEMTEDYIHLEWELTKV